MDLKLDQTDKIISLPIQKCVKYFLRYAQVDISELNLEKKPKQLPLPFPLNRVKVKKEQSPTSSKSVLNLFRVIAKEFFLKHAQAGISELKKNQSNYAPSLPLNRVKLKRKIKQYSPSPSPPLPPFSPAPAEVRPSYSLGPPEASNKTSGQFVLHFLIPQNITNGKMCLSGVH